MSFFSFAQLEIDEINLVRSCYVSSNRRKGINFLLTDKVYYQEAENQITKFLQSEKHNVVTIKKKNEETVLGWVLFQSDNINAVEIPMVNFIYIKYNYRKTGLGSLLLDFILNKKEIFYTDHLPIKVNERPINGNFLGKKFIFKPSLGANFGY